MIQSNPIHDDNLMLWEKLQQKQLKIRSRFANYTGKITALACTHFPFVDYGYINEVVKREKHLGWLVIVGDILDSFAFSTFRKEYQLNFQHEIDVAVKVIGELKKHSDGVILMSANHDTRFSKRMAERCDPELNATNERLKKGATPISLIAEEVSIEYTKLWYIKLGDVVYAHPGKGLTRPLGTVDRAANFFSLRVDDLAAVMVAHPHRLGWHMHRKMYCAEIGCMTRTPDYAWNGDIGPAGEELMYVGYATISMKHGKIDLNNSKLNFLGWTR